MENSDTDRKDFLDFVPKFTQSEQVTAQSNVESLLFSRIDRVLSERHGRISHTGPAELLSYNGSYLGRIVKKYTGRSLFDYSMTFAMDYVCDRLVNTERPVTEIAAELRFSNLSHFYRHFRETQGMTPKEYRCLYADRKRGLSH